VLVYSETWAQDENGYYLNKHHNRVELLNSEVVENNFIKNKKRVISPPVEEIREVKFTTA
jgi:hypothetical protein